MSNPGSENKNVAATEDPATPQHKEILTSRVKKEVCSKQQVAKQQMNTKKQTTKRKAQNLPKESNKDDGRLDGKEVEVQGMFGLRLFFLYVAGVLVQQQTSYVNLSGCMWSTRIQSMMNWDHAHEQHSNNLVKCYIYMPFLL